MLKPLLLCSLVLASWSAVADDSYLLGAGDKISIRVFGQDDLALKTQLTDSGTINYPFLGSIKATGLTLKQLEQLIYQGLAGDYLIAPSVFVGIDEYRPFYIHGEVKKPGAYFYQPGMTVNQAVALAGGLTERASRDRIMIAREANKAEAENASLNSRVLAGDTVTILQRFF
ncbi:capsular biosynthesis protein [Arsukibacterium ikkense]|uniref:Capsular biosynthesis protein n=1 Tax=Arsukibacterium ikkense TaxID=336831 RepID=A0A0M2VBT5_9GAMM|nr:capsular biosynthesis protein [Arsukibacterium ikkense]